MGSLLGGAGSAGSGGSIRLREAPTGGLARLLNSILVYWLSHLILDQFHLGHLPAHILLLLRMAEEHSTNYVERYGQLFSASLLERVKAGERFRLGDALSRRDRDVLYRIDVIAPSRQDVDPPFQASFVADSPYHAGGTACGGPSGSGPDA